MAVLIVGAEKNISQLKSRIVAGRVSRTKYAELTEAVRATNPNVDLQRLTPGTVLTIPDVPDLRVKDDLSVDEISRKSIDQVSEQLAAAVAAADTTSAAGFKKAKSARAALAKALDSKAVADAARRDKEVRAAIVAVQGNVEAEEAAEKEQQAAAKKAFAQWTEDLQHLRSFLGE